MTKYIEKHLMKVRVREDGTINGDDLHDGRESIVCEQCSLLDHQLFDFCDVINQLDSEFFQELKPQILSLKKILQEKYVEKGVK